MKEQKKENWTINELFDFKTGQYIKVHDLFQKYNMNNDDDLDKLILLRHELEKVIQNEKLPKIYGCWYCKGKAVLRAVKSDKRISYFKAIHSPDCKIKSKNLSKEQILRIKYNGQQESQLHIELKNKIANLLELNLLHKKEIENVIIDKPRKLSTDENSKEWKRPDIFTTYNRKNRKYRIAFELQITTTFLDVVIARQDFYKRDESYIIWVFKHFDTDRKHQKMMELDIFVSNKKNAFVINKDTIIESEKQKDLILLCIYKKYYREGKSILFDWEEEMVSLNDLTFDNEYKVFYHDAIGEYDKLSKEITKLENKEKEELRIKFENEISHEETTELKQLENHKRLAEINTKIEQIIREIRKLFKDENYEIPYWIINDLNSLENNEIEVLNEKLLFSTKNKKFLSDLIFENKNQVFLYFILEHKNIKLDFEFDLVNNETALTAFLQQSFIEEYPKVIELFWMNNYKKTDRDIEYFENEIYFNKIYVNEVSVDKADTEKRRLPYLYLAKLLILLDDKHNIERVNKNNDLKRFIFAILSVKYNTFIQWNYNNFRSLANQIFYKYEKYAFLFIKSLKYYNKLEEMIKEDKKKNGKFRAKFQEFQNKKIDYVSDENILRKIFPDLFENTT